jgi:DNA-binding LacI/PurR family transcriptional regulator
MPRFRPSSGSARAPTIFDVAALAGVSKSTVSNVVRGGDGVAGPTRERVLSAVERLGYRPNALARHLVRRRTNIVGVLVGDLANPFYAQMARGVERCAAARGYRVMFCNIEEDEHAAVEALLEQQVAGFVFLALSGRPRIDHRVPIVFAGLREAWGDSVAVSDRAGARLATEHLLGLGHRRIAYVTTRAVEPRADRARRDGYRAALARAGVAPLPVVRWEPGDGAAPPLGPDPPTAAFCSNDLGAIALLEHCDRVGVRVPGDLSVVGFDNVALAGLARISLTTVAQPLDDLARLAVDMLASRLEGSARGAPRHVTAPATLVVRGSTGRPR